MNRISTAKCKKTALRWVGEAEIQAHQGKTHTQTTVINNQEKTQRNRSFPWEERDSRTPHQVPQTLYPSQEKWSPKTLGFENQQECIQENYRAASKRKPALKGHTQPCLTQKPAQKYQTEKCMDNRWRGPTYQSWSVCCRGRNQLGCSLGTESLTGAIYVILGNLVNTNAGRHNFGILHITY